MEKTPFEHGLEDFMRVINELEGHQAMIQNIPVAKVVVHSYVDSVLFQWRSARDIGKEGGGWIFDDFIVVVVLGHGQDPAVVVDDDEHKFNIFVLRLQQDMVIMSREEAWTNFPRDLLAGALMGGVAHTIVAPVERAKLLLQTQESNLSITGGKHRRFKGMLDCILRTVRDEGVLSLWRGNGSSVLRYYPSVALNFSLKDLYRTMLISGQLHEKPLAKAPSNFLAGAAAGCTTLVIIYPLDIAHTRLAADIGNDRPSWWLAAQAVTTSAGFLSYPLDTVRRRMMMQSGLEHRVYRNTWDCWKKIYKMEGVTSFYRGALSNMFRSTGAALVLVLYDEIKNLMNSGFASTFDHSSMKLGEVPPLEHRDS
ncbi:hypothetical protein SUGI_0022720 [Cryptomeria japonica]|nr:hypothetical protein SUGI_0022720 [Cryptomeria japonica]